MGAAGAERTITNVAAGRVSATSTDAVNGSQLHATNQALGEVDGRVTNLSGQISGNGLGLVRQDPTTKQVTMAKGTGGKSIDLKGTDGERVVTGVANGVVAKDSKDAVNGGQLFETAKSTAEALGGGSKVNPDGTVSKPQYTVNGKPVEGVEGAIINIDGRVTNLGDQINGGKGIKYFRANSSLADAVVSGANSVAIGPLANASAVNAVALGHGAVADRANTVSVGSNTQQRQIVNVAKGTADTDAVNVSQLKGFGDAFGGGAKVNPDGTVTGPTYTVDGKPVNNVGEALTKLGDKINNATPGDSLVKQDATSRDINVGEETDGSRIDFTGADGERVLSGVAPGEVSTDSTEAVNGGQLFETAKSTAEALGGGSKVNPDGTVSKPQYTVNGKPVEGVEGAIINIDGRVTNLGDQINGGKGIKYFRANSSLADAVVSGANSVAIGPLANASAVNAVALGHGAVADRANTVSVGSNTQQRQIVNVAKGTADTDAVNVSQLKGFGDAFGGGAKMNPDGTVSGPTYLVDGKPVDNVGEALTKLGDKITNATPGDSLVKQDPASREITVAKTTDGKKVDFKGTEGERVVTGVANGVVGKDGKDAVNGGQLFETAKSTAEALGGGSKVNPDGTVGKPTYTVDGKPVEGVEGAITNVDGRVTNLGDQITNGTVGLVRQDPTSKHITVAKTRDGAKVDFTGTAGERVLIGVGKGVISTTSNEAINGSQLYGTNKALVDSLGGGSKLNPDGTVSGPTYTVDGKPVTNVGEALSKLGDKINNSTPGDSLVKQDPTTKQVTVAKDTGGKSVDLKGTEGERVVTGVANGVVGKDGKDAVNGGQLFETAKSTAEALGGGSKVNPDGTVGKPTYTVNGKPVEGVEGAITNIDGRVTNNSGAITRLGDQINGGKGIKYFRANSSLADAAVTGTNSVAIGPLANASAVNAVALGHGAVADRANTISVGSNTQQRQIVNVAKGTADTDAVNVSQLKRFGDALGGGTKFNPDGTVSGPTYLVDGKPVDNVGEALTRLGDKINGTSPGGNGGGLAVQDPGSKDIAIGKETGGTKVDLKGTDGERVVTGVANGGVGKDGKDAVNGGQLYETAKSTANALGGGSKVNPDGTLSKPTYVVGGKPVEGVEGAITNVDARVTNNTTAITNLANGGGVKYLNVNSRAGAASATGAEAVGIGPQASASGAGGVAVGNGAKAEADNSVALGAGSVASKANTVAVGAKGKERTISHLAAGKDDTDAVNVAQLKKSQEGGVRYDTTNGSATADHSSLSLGGPGAKTTTTVHNVRAGVAATDAVNVGQLQSGLDKNLSKANSYTDARVQELKQDAWTARRDARGGTAAAMAMAGMPQAYLPGANMLSAGVGGYQGEQALAVGLSGVTDNGRYVYKANISGNTAGEFGFAVGAGIQW